jgi:DNA repair exonuclease SbcCD nuclease subunit
MKIIAIGDSHFTENNVDEINLFLIEIEKLLSREAPDFVVFLGDLLDTHERIHSTPLNLALKFIKSVGIKCFVLVGNHDMINNSQFLTENNWMNCLKPIPNVVVVDKVICECIDGKNFVFCPYVFPGRFVEALNTLTTISWRDSTIIFAHQEFHGCKMGHIQSTIGDLWEDSFPLVISGHIHENQKPKKNIYYPGSSMSTAFGQTSKNVISIINIGKNGIDIEEIELDMPKKKIVYLDFDKVDNFNIENNSKDKVKLTINGNYEDFKSFKKTKKYKEITQSGVKVVFKQKKEKEDKIGEDKIRGEEDDKIREEEKKDETDNSFKKILLNLIQEESNIFLLKLYEEIVNEKII